MMMTNESKVVLTSNNFGISGINSVETRMLVYPMFRTVFEIR
jgi:hypothetical protein